MVFNLRCIIPLFSLLHGTRFFRPAKNHRRSKHITLHRRSCFNSSNFVRNKNLQISSNQEPKPKNWITQEPLYQQIALPSLCWIFKSTSKLNRDSTWMPNMSTSNQMFFFHKIATNIKLVHWEANISSIITQHFLSFSYRLHLFNSRFLDLKLTS